MKESAVTSFWDDKYELCVWREGHLWVWSMLTRDEKLEFVANGNEKSLIEVFKAAGEWGFDMNAPASEERRAGSWLARALTAFAGIARKR